MIKLTFVDHEGNETDVEGEAGHSLMEAARSNGVPGIDADCGGMCACATCHVIVDAAFADLLPPVSECEAPMLEFVDDATPHSRLACQVMLSEELSGLRVTTPESQK